MPRCYGPTPERTRRPYPYRRRTVARLKYTHVAVCLPKSCSDSGLPSRHPSHCQEIVCEVCQSPLYDALRNARMITNLWRCRRTHGIQLIHLYVPYTTLRRCRMRRRYFRCVVVLASSHPRILASPHRTVAPTGITEGGGEKGGRVGIGRGHELCTAPERISESTRPGGDLSVPAALT